jgi:uncharacterized protein
MKNAILLHGRPSKEEYYKPGRPNPSNAHWFPWLQGQLLKSNIFAVTPEVPLAFEPLWERWVKEVERFEIGQDTTLVGHSCGGGFWARYLSEHPDLKVGKVVLVAPWIDVEQEDPNKFFDFKIDPNLVGRTKELVIFNSTDDVEEIQSSVRVLREQLKNAKYKEFEGLGHFTHKKLPSDTFPELLAECLS